MKKLITLSILLLWCGIIDGTMDTVKFHYHDSVFLIDEPRTEAQEKFYRFSYEESWRNAYKDYYEGEPPHEKKWWVKGVFSFVPYDLWHVLKDLLLISLFFTMWYVGILVKDYMMVYYSEVHYPPYLEWIVLNWERWWFCIGFVITAWILYGAMHEVMFKVLLKSTWI